MLAKEEPDCDHVSESNYDDRQHALSYKSNIGGINEDLDSDNDVSNIHPNHHHLHHLRSSLKLESALMEYNEGLNLINKPNSNVNDDNNNSASASNDNNNNNTNNSVKGGDGINKTARKLFECDVCNVSSVFKFY